MEDQLTSSTPLIPNSPWTKTSGRTIVAIGIALAIGSLVIVAVALPEGAATSSDPGAPTVSWWALLLPSLAGIILCLVLPWAPTAQPVLVRDVGPLRSSTTILLIIAVVFPVIVGIPGVASSGWYLLAKVSLLTVVAGIIVALFRGCEIDRATGAWRWWAPTVVVAVWTALGPAAPWAAPNDFSGFDPIDLLIISSLTALTAGVGEELFYRRWLQTRIEALLGPWPGIIIASSAFALMHLGSHGTGEPLIDIPRLLVTHGSFGLFMGVMWWRYRNLTLIILAHVISNGWAVGEFFLFG